MARYKVKIVDLEVEIDDTLLYTKTDEWLRVEDGLVRVGVTDYAQKMLKDIVSVELPEVGDEFEAGDEAATLESVKHTAPVYAPVSGEVAEVNERLLEEPELINKDPYGEGWILALKPREPVDPSKFLDHRAYVEKLMKEREEG